MTRKAREAADDTAYDAMHERVYPREYLEGIAHFNAGRYYAAHEVWEEIWLRSTGDARLFYHMLIQAAVALYHDARGNAHGARVLYGRACKKLAKLPPVLMSLDVLEFARQFHAYFAIFHDGDVEPARPGDTPRPWIRLMRSR